MTAKILVVDDSITIQKIVAMAFENEDASVEGIGNGDEALARLKTFQHDIVLADVEMPGLNGFELSREIKESSKLNSIPVLLLASDFEEFDENLFRASLADDHITKPFKSEDLVRKVRELLDGGALAVAEEETEEVIELSSTDRVDEDVVIDLSEDQLMDSLEGVSSEEEEVDLDLPHNHELTGPDDKEDGEQDELAAGDEDEKVFPGRPPEEDLPVEVAITVDDQAEMEIADQEESLDALLIKVEELSRKSEEILDNGSPEELSRMEAIDAMLKEVSALKDESCFVAAEDGNNIRETTDSQLSPDPAESEAVLAEVDVSEENAEALEAAFDEITNGKKVPASATEPSEHQESICQEDPVATEPENLIGDFATPALSTEHENPLPNLKEEPSPAKEKITAPDASEENIKKDGELQLPPEEQLRPLAETEVRRILQQTLTSLIEKEISGLSEKIIQTVEENVRKITPGIAKEIIQKEIDKIKTDG